ncbi:hypothetical protein HELRODRAFT_159884 [Helobdella robusta]|uniref:Uncharacterized protein n=1 Tax=Helobdella robusta TaxID=6412 RepID=T1EPH9_HELRO|nr:hypothetical protein HELRODRAFT_159884 [Helobdella robusta]ESO05808.1 hypothetical protein HELRODRAFT_159884 [Helobdella robusta]
MVIRYGILKLSHTPQNSGSATGLKVKKDIKLSSASSFFFPPHSTTHKAALHIPHSSSSHLLPSLLSPPLHGVVTSTTTSSFYRSDVIKRGRLFVKKPFPAHLFRFKITLNSNSVTATSELVVFHE